MTLRAWRVMALVAQTRRGRKARAMRMLSAAAGGVGAGATALPLRGATANVSVNATQLGVTPLYLGYNMGHYMATSNTSAWVGYQAPNSFRVWANASEYEPASGNYGDGVTNLSQFEANKSAVRANPETTPLIPWAGYNANWDDVQSGRNK